MLRLFSSFFFLFILLPPPSVGSPSIFGSWQFKSEQIEVVAEFLPDGTFRQVNITPKGRETYTGRYQLTDKPSRFSYKGLLSPSRSSAASPMPIPSLPLIPLAKPCSGGE